MDGADSHDSFDLHSSVAEERLQDLAPIKDHDPEPSKLQGRSEMDKSLEKENMQEGEISYEVFKSYVDAAGGVTSVSVVLVLFIVGEIMKISSDMWFSSWTKNSSDTTLDQRHQINVYIMLVSAFVLLSFLRGFSLFAVLLRASKRMHERAFHAVMYTYLSFFEDNPSGQLINRFSTDIDICDTNLPLLAFNSMSLGVQILGMLCTIAYAFPAFLLLVIPLAQVLLYSKSLFAYANRDLKRLDGGTKTLTYSYLVSAVQGITSIRSYNREDYILKLIKESVDMNHQVYFSHVSASRWFGLRLEATSVVLIFFTSVFCVLLKDSLPFSIVGLCLTYVISFTGIMQLTIRTIVDCESRMTSVERLCKYTDSLEPEENEIVELSNGVRKVQGRVEFKDYSLRYKDELPTVLKGIDAEIEPCEKVGIVGRTGAGKSSLIAALLRLCKSDLSTGQILIDGVDTKTMSLQELRTLLSVIPQDPVLFIGSMRFNLDPFSEKTDQEIWSVLNKVHMKRIVEDFPTGLEHIISEGGQNLSVGQRQLICIGRALLRDSKIILMDEATASVDFDTDALIQTTIRESFKDCTVITIAHRLNTIIDADKVMVLSKGELVEFGPPSHLLDVDSFATDVQFESKSAQLEHNQLRRSGDFYNLVKRTGASSARHLISKARIQAEDSPRNQRND
eukprot:TRINITY_DN951_c0_g1_i2.p1 TRINITY_DN951_c0_g1~~TRINITY_DN951_c0_g1_i2.p1  ORF type:complete len:677 (+),score=185.46 TRINITY_DN951_c0_g1_i2:744-2774(+)